MRPAILAFALLLSALPSKAETWTGPAVQDRAQLHAGALPGAVGGAYQSTAGVGYVNYADQGKTEAIGSYRRYLPHVVLDDEEPYRLQPFLQHASYLQGTFAGASDDSNLFSVSGLYYLEQVRLGVGGELGLGATSEQHTQWALGAGATYYFTDDHDFALELDLSGATTEKKQGQETKEEQTSTYAVGVRWVIHLTNAPGILEVAGGYRSIEREGVLQEGIVVDARYFFNKQLFAGAGFAQEPDALRAFFGYATPENFQAELEIGNDEAVEVGGDYFRIEVGLRF